MSDSLVRKHVWITGLVQGVWFRGSTRRMAAGLGVSGWARNLPDGRVEAVFEGPADTVAAAVAWVHDGPSAARVDEVQVIDEEPEGITGFGTG